MGTLRLFLAVSVLVTHLRYGRGILGLSFLNGGLAVECFFIISGFYMALVLNEKYNYRGSYGEFILQRFLRLYPLYLLIGVLILGLDGIASYAIGHPFGIYAVWAGGPRCITFLSGCYYSLVNLVILGLDSLWFVQEDTVTGQLYLSPYVLPHANQCINYIVNGPTWTLSVEMSFYLIAPFLVRKSVKVQAVFLLASLALRWAFYLTMDPKSLTIWNYYFSPSDLFFFMAGSLGYHYYRKYRAQFESFARRYAWSFWVIGALCLVQGRMPGKDYFPFVFIPVAVVFVPLLFAYTRNNYRDRLLGELSYPYYLLHHSVVVTAEYFLHENYNFLFGPVCALVTLGLAYFFYNVFEIRTEHFRARLFEKISPSKRSQVLPSAAVASIEGRS